jgi:hypothetical protein
LYSDSISPIFKRSNDGFEAIFAGRAPFVTVSTWQPWVKQSDLQLLRRGSAGEVLKTMEGVAVGFVDGDFDWMWHS